MELVMFIRNKPGQPTDLTYLPSQRKTAHSNI